MNGLKNEVLYLGSDMIALLDPKPSSYIIEQTFDKTLFKKTVDEFDLNFALGTLDILPHQLASLENYPNASSENVAEWVEK